MTYTNIQFLKDMWLFLEGRRAYFLSFTFIRFLSAASEFIDPLLIGLIITFFTKYSAGDSLTPFYLLVSGIVITVILRILTRFYSKYHLQKIGALLRKDLRVKAMGTLLKLDIAWHEEQDTGSKIQKITSGGDNIIKILHQFSNAWLSILSTVFVGLIALLVIDWIYFLYALVVLIIYAYFHSIFYDKLNDLKKEELIKGEMVSGKIHESASNITSIKSTGVSKKVIKNTEQNEKAYFKSWLKHKKFSFNRNITMLVIMTISWGGFLLLIGHDFLQGAFAVGFIVTLSGYFNQYRNALHKGIWEIAEFGKAKVSTERFMTILGADQFREQEVGKKNIPKTWKSITFNNLSFAYKKTKALHKVSFRINKGEKVAFVGKSGSGKSTITKLLLNLYEPKEGSIKIGNQNLRDIKQSQINHFFAVVPQDSEVFNASIQENITLGRTSKLTLQEVAKCAQLTPVLKKSKNKFNTIIGEKGYKLSGGERQRLGIARALYGNFSALILDEATSALDSNTEKKIVNTIQKKFTKTTQIIVAHRLSTIEHVDKIIFLDKGKIKEQGSHKELIKKKGAYYNMWKLQNR